MFSGLVWFNLERDHRGRALTRAYAAPSCSPCRTSLLTGVHVPVHGVIENGWARYRPGLLVYPDLLKQAGYDCSVYGKTHFKPEPPSLDVVVPVNAKTKAKGRCNALDMRRGGGGECRIEEKDFLETVLVDAVKKLKTARDGPWFAHVSLLAPQPVSLPPKGWGNRFKIADLPAVDHRPGDFAKLPEETKLLLHNTSTRTYKHPYVKATDGSLIRRVVDAERVAYYSLCAYVDAQLFDHGVQNSKHTFLEASWRVPLLARWPGVLPAGGEATFASTVDLTATILAAAGAGVPRSMAGYDLVAPFRGAGAARTRAAAVAGALYRASRWSRRYKLV
ncbi:sulfuric ester hydrolase [Aureococcus anophagefferens]|nr:sulfuric ester hydrolase [Aureococcus anophagefferens]